LPANEEETAMSEVRIERFESPTEARTFEKGRFELIDIGGVTVGRATYEPGWKWSEHVGPTAGTKSCQVEHVGLVVSGHAAVRMDDGTELVMRAGDLFHVPPGHDSWVVGDDPYVSLHFLGAEEYASG
jgi:quercetin dioxygenase-like cupin family protein